MSKPKEKKNVIYISKIRSLRLINKAAYTKEVEGRVVVVSGGSIQFKDGKFVTSNPAEIEFLDNHPNCGGVFIKIPSKVKDIVKEQRDNAESLSEKTEREREEAEAEEIKGKQLEEGSSLPGKKGKGKGKGKGSKKSEKPVF